LNKYSENVCFPNVIKLSFWNVRDILNKVFSLHKETNDPNRRFQEPVQKTAVLKKCSGFYRKIGHGKPEKNGCQEPCKVEEPYV